MDGYDECLCGRLLINDLCPDCDGGVTPSSVEKTLLTYLMLGSIVSTKESEESDVD